MILVTDLSNSISWPHFPLSTPATDVRYNTIKDNKNELQSIGDNAQQIISSVSGSDAENADISRKKARVTFSMDVGSQSSPVSTSDNHSKDIGAPSKDVVGHTQKSNDDSKLRSARAQRSLRRQAKVYKEVGHGARSQRAVSLKKQLSGSNIDLNSSALPKRKVNQSEEVVKVKFNTGTLLLYKGQNRRAVFLRRC